MTFIDFFAGIGGFTIGLQRAGFKCIGYCEKDKYAIESYQVIHTPNEKEWFSDDIAMLKSNDIPYADGWTAGFPCQDISVSGKQSGLNGHRSGLFFEIIRLIRGKAPEDKPRWLLFENVKNLLSINGGRDFTEILYQLSEVGYDCEWQLINSKSYLPQNRERVFIIGHLRGYCCRKVFPIGVTNTKAPIQLIGGCQGNRVYHPSGVSVTLTSQGGGGGAKTGLYLIELNENSQSTNTAERINARNNAGVTSQDADNSGIFLFSRVGKNAAKILMTSCSDGTRTVCGRIRKLTPLECFRLQGFTDEMFYKVQAINSDNQLYKQIGNSVTIPVIYEIGRKLWEVYHAGTSLL